MISIIVAIAENYAIGKNNDLLWHLPNDLKRFKELTTGHKIIMGKNTYLSLPKRPLPNRENIVITDVNGELFEGATTVYAIDGAAALITGNEEAFIIGGGMVYRQFLPLANRLYLTKVHCAFDADIFFPELDWSLWREISHEDFSKDEHNPYNYSYLILDRK